MRTEPRPRLAVSVGEPAGIGPDIVVKAAPELSRFNIVLLADPQLMLERAELLGREFQVRPYASGEGAPGLRLAPVRLARPCRAGRPDTRNAPAVLAAIDRGVAGCLNGEFDALVTGPVNKAVMRQAGLDFMGHTEYLARASGASTPVMLLACESGDGHEPLRVALATTHIPLSAVPGAITHDRVTAVLDVLVSGLKSDFGISRPRVAVLGLNPHAGEDGELGSEDRDIVAGAITDFGNAGVTGPWPADTAFTPDHLARQDAVLAMYHDQGLPVIKHAGFGRTVNVTLGLPFVRTSVDHGTAFDIVGVGKAGEGSLIQAVVLAERLARGKIGRSGSR